jgi:hypothetical protein
MQRDRMQSLWPYLLDNGKTSCKKTMDAFFLHIELQFIFVQDRGKSPCNLVQELGDGGHG